jgi:hypothetical protein
MDQYIGLDVSLKDTAVSIRENRKRIWRGKCPSDPKVISQIIRKHAPHAKLVVFETGPLSTWFYHALNAERIEPGAEKIDQITHQGETVGYVIDGELELTIETSTRGFYSPQASAMLLIIIVTVSLMDLLSQQLRKLVL